jgi:hypothetical protein
VLGLHCFLFMPFANLPCIYIINTFSNLAILRAQKIEKNEQKAI